MVRIVKQTAYNRIDNRESNDARASYVKEKDGG